MPFKPISIREAISSIQDEDWVLPVTQRPYVWGDRSDYRRKILRFFDSLYRNYPVGAFLLWQTKERIPFRGFTKDFDPEADLPTVVDQGLWDRKKWLVYDGQQRLQTLYSCLKYKFVAEVLCFDLFFDLQADEEKIGGFRLRPSNGLLEPRLLRLNTLYEEYRVQGKDGVTFFREGTVARLLECTEHERHLAQHNIDVLWNLFNNEQNEVCGYFTILKA